MHNALIACVRFWEDQQRHRIRVGNLVGAIQRTGVEIPNTLNESLNRLKDSENAIQKLVITEFRKHPLAEYCKSIRGLGEHNAAVLLAMLDGDPYIAYPKYWQKTNSDQSSITKLIEDGTIFEDTMDFNKSSNRVLVRGEPFTRTPSQLWAYCGIGKPGKRTAGISQEEALAFGKPMLKSRMRLIAESFIKANNPTYRAIYDAERTKVESRKHEKPCPPCHAREGDPWKKGHQHAHALRIIAKRFLLDLWLQAKAINAMSI